MKTILFLINLSAAWVEMDSELQLAPTGCNVFWKLIVVLNSKSWLPDFNNYVTNAIFSYPSNLFRVFGCVPGSNEATTLEASKSPMR